MSNVSRLPKREEVASENKWMIEDLYANDQDWENEYKQIEQMLPQLVEFQGHLGDSSQVLFRYMQLNDEVSKLFERVYVYANQRYHENTANATYQKLVDLSSNLMVKMTSATSFATSEILQIPVETMNSYYEQEPSLRVYQRYFENIYKKKPHILSKEEERILAEVGDVTEAAGNIFSMFNNADIKFPVIEAEDGSEVEITHARYSLLLQSKEHRVRKDAFEALYSSYEKYKNTLASMFSSNLKSEAFYAKIRNYESTMAMELSGGNIPISVYENLLEVVHENLPLLHRYVSIRKKVLGLEELHMYDLYVPMVSEAEMKISFDKAKDMVCKGLEPLGSAYQEVLNEGFTKGWIDVYENEGKRCGAYSWGAYGTHPYVLLNYQENLNNVFTLAHEMGHAIHSYYSDETQPYIYAGYKIFVAEVASTCNEALLMHHLLKTTEDKRQRAYLINYQLEQFRTTLYRQAMFAEFEMITHKMVAENIPLTAEALCEVYHKLNETYFGEDIVVDSQIDMEWARIPHFYNSFYVYQYATGYSAAIALSQRILNEGEVAIQEYLSFLCGGSSKDPIDLLKGAGVDMTTKKPIEDALSVFESLLDEFESLV